jgi:proteasome lid subunit RPN8/RPN11
MTTRTQEPLNLRRLELKAGLKARLHNLAASAYPNETCGLLLGRSSGGFTRVEQLLEARNVAPDRRRHFEMAAEDILQAELEAEKAGLDVVGVWHSHPDHPAVPSETDRAVAWTGYSYVITRVNGGRPAETRSWRLEDEEFSEERIES